MELKLRFSSVWSLAWRLVKQRHLELVCHELSLCATFSEQLQNGPDFNGPDMIKLGPR